MTVTLPDGVLDELAVALGVPLGVVCRLLEQQLHDAVLRSHSKLMDQLHQEVTHAG